MRKIFFLSILLVLVYNIYSEDKSIEIRDYKGIKLGSLSDYADNSILGIQELDASQYTLRVEGLVENKIAMDYQSLQKLPHIQKLVTLNCVEGWKVKSLWEGIPLKELFKKAVPLKKTDTVIFYASDGYSTSLPYSYIMEKNIIIADKVNGITLPPVQGYPFILIAEDKWGYKWCRWIVRIELSDNTYYKGYWEQQGYSQSGDLTSDY